MEEAQQQIATLEYGDYKARIYSTTMPGEFKICYIDGSGKEIEEAPLTGVSTYKQRETEILDRLRQFADGAAPQRTPDLGDSGEY